MHKFSHMDKIIEDEQLGRLVIRVNARARRLIFRTKSDAIYVSVPPHTSMKEVERAIEQLRGKLAGSRERLSCTVIDLDYKIETDFFRLSLATGSRDQFLAHSELGKMQIVCPPSADFADERLQEWLRKVVEEALRRNAKIVLPPRLRQLATQHGFTCGNVKINSSRGRWGSCSAQKNINLSYFLLLLPVHLIDYVLLHELCHTREMNHSDRFWALMDKVSDGKADAWREELKKYRTEL